MVPFWLFRLLGIDLVSQGAVGQFGSFSKLVVIHSQFSCHGINNCNTRASDCKAIDEYLYNTRTLIKAYSKGKGN